jgi:hypothetical protein
MKVKTLLVIYALFIFMWACSTSDEATPNPSPTGQLPSSLSYTSNQVTFCVGTTTGSSNASIQGTKPITYTITVQPTNSKITIDGNGKIMVASDAPAGTFKVSVTATNAVGSQTFTDVLTVNATEANTAGVSFNKDVKPLVQSKCTPCHVSGGSQPNWTNYSNAKNNIANMIARTESGSMPQGGPPLTAAEIQVFKDWMNNCFLESNP